MISRTIAGSACCCGGIVVGMSLSLSLLPRPTTSFAWSSSSPPSSYSSYSSSRSRSFAPSRSASMRRHYVGGGDERSIVPLMNATDCAAGAKSRQTTTTSTPPSSYSAAAAAVAVIPPPPAAAVEAETSATTLLVLQQHILEGYIAHRALLRSVADDAVVELISTTTRSSPRHDGEGPSTAHRAPLAMPSIDMSDAWKARSLLLLSAALYGTNFSIVKSIDEIDGMSIGMASTLRFGFAAFAMMPMLFVPIDVELKRIAMEGRGRREEDDGDGDGVVATTTRGVGGMDVASPSFARGIWGLNGEEGPTRLGVGLAGMEIGLYNSIGYLAQAVGLKTTTASKSAFICSMAVVTVPILDFLWGKRLLRRQIIGACLAAFGVFALELGGQQTTISDGDLMSLVQPIVFGLGFWRMEAAMEKYPTEAGRLAAAQLLTVFLVSLAYLVCWPALGIVSDACDAMPPTATEIMGWLSDPNILVMFVWTGLITTAFTIWMETLALRTLSAAETTLIFSTEPLFGAAFAAVVANECLGVDDAIGALFIVVGCLVSGMDASQFRTRRTEDRVGDEGIMEHSREIMM